MVCQARVMLADLLSAAHSQFLTPAMISLILNVRSYHTEHIYLLNRQFYPHTDRQECSFTLDSADFLPKKIATKITA